METVLYIVHILVCIGLLPIILLQSGKGGGVSAVFGGGSSGTVFGSRGASTFLTRMTTASAIIFMVTSLGLSYISSKSRSVVPKSAPKAAETTGAGAAPVGEQSSAPGTGSATTAE
jgi:preprotein translocase subunit SecG